VVNEWGQHLVHRNAKESVTKYKYDLLSQVTKVREADGNVRELEYDAMGNIVRAKDSNRNVQFTCRGVNNLAMRAKRGEMLASFMTRKGNQPTKKANATNFSWTLLRAMWWKKRISTV
jgi:YD repeat-containing protein